MRALPPRSPAASAGRLRASATLLALVTALILALGKPAAAPASQVVVDPAAGRTGDARRAALAAGATRVRRLPASGLLVAELPAPALPAVAAARVEASAAVDDAFADRIARVATEDPAFAQLWGLHNTGQTGGTADADVDAPEAWAQLDGRGAGQVVAVLDTGIDATHPELASRIALNAAERDGRTGVDDDANGYVDDVRGWDLVNRDANPADDHGHGTHVAGTIAAARNGSSVQGIASDAHVLAVKVLGADGSGSYSGILEGFAYAAGRGARVANASLSGASAPVAALSTILAAHPRMAAVAAAGNAGKDLAVTQSWPCNQPEGNLVCVGATDHSDRLASFSNFGGPVDVYAPGVGILSTVRGGATASWNGTSMATPQVAGALALLAARTPSATGARLVAHGVESAEQPPVALPSGRGRLNAARALAATPADDDGDGVPDDSDRCPTAAGDPALDGCPDRDGDRVADLDDRCPDVAGVAEDGGCPPDADADGVPDARDRCPSTPGDPALDGCPDRDGDRVPDASDRCPDAAGDRAGDGCPPPPPDRDRDGIADDADLCVAEPGPAERRGCPPPPDRDGDGVLDRDDRCPDERGAAGDEGCPRPAVAPLPPATGRPAPVAAPPARPVAVLDVRFRRGRPDRLLVRVSRPGAVRLRLERVDCPRRCRSPRAARVVVGATRSTAVPLRLAAGRWHARVAPVAGAGGRRAVTFTVPRR